MSGHFDAFRNRQKRDESSKSLLRNKIRTKKKGLVDDAIYNAKDQFDLPDVSKAELERLKAEIRNRIKKQKFTQIIIALAISLIIIVALLLLVIKKNIIFKT